jgi:hypothetical protein
MEEPLPPLADDLAREIKALSDLIVLEVLSGQQHDPGTNDIAIR